MTDCALIHRPTRRHAGVLWLVNPHSESWTTLSHSADTHTFRDRLAATAV